MWAKLGDETARRPQVRDAGLHGGKLWYASLTEVAAARTDGRISARLAKDIVYVSCTTLSKAIPDAVAAGLWHDDATVCGPCLDHGGDLVEPGEFFLHEWWLLLQDAAGAGDALHRWREARRRHLNRQFDLVASIRQRDHDRCRYCGVATIDSSGPDKKSPKVRTLDHVDPFSTDGPKGYGNTPGNVVVACNRCNGRKRDRLPEDAGMVLHDSGWRSDYQDQNQDQRSDNQDQRPGSGRKIKTKNPTGPRVTRDPGRAGSRSGFGLDSGLDNPTGADRVGSPSGLGPFDDPIPNGAGP